MMSLLGQITFCGKTRFAATVIPAEAGIQVVQLREASNFSAFGAGYDLGSSFRWNDAVVSLPQ
jgi:hypothetical protein